MCSFVAETKTFCSTITCKEYKLTMKLTAKISAWYTCLVEVSAWFSI